VRKCWHLYPNGGDSLPFPPVNAFDGAGRLTLLVTADGVGPGMLTWPAWEVVRKAGDVLGRDIDPRWVQALGDAGVVVREVPDQPVAELALRLLGGAREGGHLVWFVSPDGDPGLAEAITSALTRSPSTPSGEEPSVELVLGSYDLPGARLLDLVAVMERLRSPGGCPWDASQTHESLVPYALEEAFELAEAVETGDRAHLLEELGDLLLQVAFHARVATEHPESPFDIDDVASGIVTKLRRRHPHVFGDGTHTASTPQEVETSWHAIKAAEKGRRSVLDGVPLALPALARADKLLGRVERAGLDVPGGDLRGVSSAAELGERLLALVVSAREAGLDAEAALRQAVRKLEDGAREAEGSPTTLTP
jgi:XTP/dITP diphosphohydrolase